MTRAGTAVPWLLVLASCGSARGPATDARGARVEDARYLALGGLEQWITIRADDDRKPVLLLVHGGPGDVQSPYVATYAPYERDFVLVQWDQLGTGRTYARYGDRTPELTLEQLARDGIQLAEYLRRRFRGNRIVVLGHSWGTAIATQMVLKRPDLFAAYVGTGQIASWAESVQAQFDYLSARARETGNAEMSAQLEAIGRPDPMNPKQYFTFIRPLRQFLNPSDRAWLARALDLLRHSPGMSEKLMSAMQNGAEFSGQALLPIQMEERLSSEALRFELPYYLIQGHDDWFTPTAPAQAYFDKIQAPRKRMVILENAGHFALVTHASAFVAALRDVLR